MPADPERCRLGRSVQAGIDVGQACQPDGTHQREDCAEQQQGGGEPIDKRSNHSMMSPRNRYLASAMVLTKPSRAISSAASKKSGRPM